MMLLTTAMMNDETTGQQGVASSNPPTKKIQQPPHFTQATLTSTLQLTHHTHQSHQLSLMQHKNKNGFTHNSLNLATFNMFKKGQQMVGDLLRLMCDLKLHIIARKTQANYFKLKKEEHSMATITLNTFNLDQEKMIHWHSSLMKELFTLY